MIEPTVTISLESLDKLRDEKKQLEEKVKHYQATEKQVRLVFIEKTKEWTRDIPTYGYKFISGRQVDKFIEREAEYVNFEDVLSELREKAEHNVIEKLGEKDRSILSLKKEIQDLTTTHKEELLKIEKKYKDTEKELRDNNLKTVDSLQKEIRTLKEEKIDLTKDEEILKLKQQIVELQQVKPNWSLFKFLNK